MKDIFADVFAYFKNAYDYKVTSYDILCTLGLALSAVGAYLVAVFV